MTTKIDESVLDGLTAQCKTPGDVTKLYTQMLQRVIDRSLAAELDAHLGYDRHEKVAEGSRDNARNGGRCQERCPPIHAAIASMTVAVSIGRSGLSQTVPIGFQLRTARPRQRPG